MRSRTSAWFASIALAGFVLDVASKSVVFSSIPYGDPRPILPGVFVLEVAANPGGPWGLFPSVLWTLLSVAAVPVLAFAFLRIKAPTCLEIVGLALVSAGALGNAWDRVTLGVVRDFLRIDPLPVFNGADAMLTMGAVLLGAVWLIHDRRSLRPSRPAVAPEPPDGRLGDVRGDDGPRP